MNHAVSAEQIVSLRSARGDATPPWSYAHRLHQAWCQADLAVIGLLHREGDLELITARGRRRLETLHQPAPGHVDGNR